jgi:A/G-specific adenine glycosylase
MGKFREGLLALSAWFERQKRVLPWRDDPSLYRVWVSEIMLQQTQVVTVVPYFERFIARFPTVQALAQASEDEVVREWAGLGYYSRARNLHRAARLIAAGGFPRDRGGWLEVPGVGDYTAGAILSIALGEPEAILDGNVERVLSRVRRVGRQKGDAAFKARLWRLSRAFVERSWDLGVSPSVVNQALMELGAMVCAPKKPRCLLCPLSGVCRARMEGVQEEYPPRKKPKQWVAVEEEVHCVLDGEGRVLLERREKGEWRAGLWDFAREAPAGARKVGVVETKHVVTRHKIARVTHVWRASKALLRASEMGGACWVDLRAPEVAVGSAVRRVWEKVCERF